MEIRIPPWLKTKALATYPNVSKKIRELLMADLKFRDLKYQDLAKPIKKIPKISTIKTTTNRPQLDYTVNC